MTHLSDPSPTNTPPRPTPPPFTLFFGNESSTPVDQTTTNSTEPNVNILLYISLAFIALAVFSFCLQTVLAIRRELRAPPGVGTQPPPALLVQGRPMTAAQIKRLPIKVFIPQAVRRQRELERVQKTKVLEAARGRDVAVEVREEAQGQGGLEEAVRIPIVGLDSVAVGDTGHEREGGEANGDVPCCPVCLEDFMAYEVLRQLPCEHRFHRRCIDPWLSKSSLCPTCRFNSLRKATAPRSEATTENDGSSIASLTDASEIPSVEAGLRQLEMVLQEEDWATGVGHGEEEGNRGNQHGGSSSTTMFGRMR
ncbi:hypothetical protein HDU98_001532 [Podochytrium sp. JEL0797]|nr:hypothetical protein HDU98_001532 [Podochytrium sp. JEL0797]